MMRLKIFSNLVGQLFQQTFGLSFVVVRKQHTTVCGRKVLNNRVVGIGREDPYCFRAIDLIQVSAVLILSCKSIRGIPRTSGFMRSYHSRKEAATPYGYPGLSSQIRQETRCTFAHGSWRGSCSMECLFPLQRMDGEDQRAPSHD